MLQEFDRKYEVKNKILFFYLQWREYSIMELGIFSHPRVTVVDVRGSNVLVYYFRHNHKPFGQEVSLKF